MNRSDSELLKAALGYVARGWFVFPLHTPVTGGCSCRRGKDCNGPGKHPRTENGLSDASTDQAQIRDWWSRWPYANIGIRTGSESGLLVVDVDNKNGRHGGQNLAAVAALFGGLPLTLTASTGSGEHLFFEHRDADVHGSVGKLTDGVDVRAEGGYVVAAPSLHENGSRYRWQDADQPLAEVPAWLIAKFISRKESTAKMYNSTLSLLADGGVVPKGERNDTLHRLGCALRGTKGMEQIEITAILIEFNKAKCEPPLGEEEVLEIVVSVCKHPAEFATKKSANRLDQSPLYWFPMNTREWFSDLNLAVMDDAQTGWHIRLKMFAWDAGGFLPGDHAKLWKLAKAKSQKVFKSKCGIVLAEYEEVERGGVPMLRNPRMATQYSDTLEKWMKKKQAGEASKMARQFVQTQPSGVEVLRRFE